MQATSSDIFDCNISSTCAVQMTTPAGPQSRTDTDTSDHSDQVHQLSENTESITEASLMSAEAIIIQPDVRSNCTKMSDCKLQHDHDDFSSKSSGKEEEECVNSQQIGSPSSDDNEDDESWNPDDCDNGSEISEFSDFSQESWQPVQGPIAWVQEQMRRGQSPRKILEDLVPSGTVIPEGLDPIMLWKIIINIVSEPPKRKKLNDVNTLDDVLQLLNTSKKIIVLTGAGVSVSCGIPDFRSRGGVYVRLAKDFPNLPDPQAMFDIHFFRNDPRPFFKFAREIYPGQFKPSPCHRFIHMLEEKGKLLRNYTQNIDTLEQVAGIQRVVQCHGSFATATCTVCGHKVDSNAIKEDIFNQVIPHCSSCSPSDQNAVMKPDIVFFGESLPEHFHNQMAADKDECDLLIVIGSSLKVRPVALIPNSLPASIPQILINRERLHYLNFDVELLGNCDEIIGELCRRLGPGWEELATAGPPINEVLMSSLPTPPASPQSGNQVLFLPPSRYVFKGAEIFSGSESDSEDDSSDEDDSSVDNDVDKLSKVFVSEKPNTENNIDSPTSAPKEERLNQQQLLPSSSAGDRLKSNIIGSSTPNTPATQSCNGFDQEVTSVQHNECTPLSDVKCAKKQMSDGLITCPVSSTEDFYLGQPAQISNRLHSLQDQRD